MNQVIVLAQLPGGDKAIFFARVGFTPDHEMAMETVAELLGCEPHHITIVSVQDSPFNQQMPFLAPFVLNEEEYA